MKLYQKIMGCLLAGLFILASVACGTGSGSNSSGGGGTDVPKDEETKEEILLDKNERSESLFSFFGERKKEEGSSLKFSTKYSQVTDWHSDEYDLRPERVHHATLTRKTGNPETDWEIRIGKGGQIYSFITPEGEAIPPQNHLGGPWMDEVFQQVTCNTDINNNKRRETIYKAQFFYIHQGTYYMNPQTRDMLDPDYLDYSYYAPMLSEYFDEEENAYYSLVWGQHAHLPTVQKSGLLYYSKIKDMGDGVIECTYAMHNTDPIKLNWLCLPWGGVRSDTYPEQFFMNIKNKPVYLEQYWSENFQVNTSVTGGLVGWTVDRSENSKALGMILPRDMLGKKGYEKQYQASRIRIGRTEAHRNTNVVSNIIPANVEQGDTFLYRFYFVIGNLNKQSQKLAQYRNRTYYGYINSEKKETDAYTVQIDGVAEADLKEYASKLYPYPFIGSEAVYLLKDVKNNQLVLSTDLYRFASTAPYENPLPETDPKYEMYNNREIVRPYDGNTEFLELIGYREGKQ